jgi:alkylhydroperoxidase family enzyme
MSPEVADLLDRVPPLRIFQMLAHAETCIRPFMRFGSAILTEQALDAKLRELAILRVASLSGAEYEWVQHVPIASAAGVSGAQVDALQAGDTTAACFDDLERLVLDFTTEVVHEVRASDATLAALTARIPTREVVELTLAIGYYMLVARFLETTGVDLDPPLDPRR